MKKAYSEENDMKMNGTGGRACGDGIYTVSGQMKIHNIPERYTDLKDQSLLNSLESEVLGYGDCKTRLKMAWLSKPKITNESSVKAEFNKLTPAERAKFGNHMNTYACAKGYDAVYTNAKLYMVIFNRSKLAICNE